MRIVKNPEIILYQGRHLCLFCKRELNGNIFCETALEELLPLRTKLVSTKYLIHISCGYKFLKQLKKISLEDKKTLALLEGKYIKELTLDLIK